MNMRFHPAVPRFSGLRIELGDPQYKRSADLVSIETNYLRANELHLFDVVSGFYDEVPVSPEVAAKIERLTLAVKKLEDQAYEQMEAEEDEDKMSLTDRFVNWSAEGIRRMFRIPSETFGYLMLPVAAILHPPAFDPINKAFRKALRSEIPDYKEQIKDIINQALADPKYATARERGVRTVDGNRETPYKVAFWRKSASKMKTAPKGH